MMPLIKLYIATTIDGYIAREDGSLDWLENLPNPTQTDYGYADFYSEIDTVVMGRITYEEILGFDVPYPYSDCKSIIVSSNPNYHPNTHHTYVIHSIDNQTIEKIREESKKNIWIVGGGKIITEFLNHDAIDDMMLCVIPAILGKGIPLFPNHPKETQFELVQSEFFESGAVMLTYKK